MTQTEHKDRLRAIKRSRPTVRGQHAGRLRWPGPRSFSGVVGSMKLPHLHPRQVLSVPEGDIDSFLDAGFEWLGWCAP